MGYKRIAVHLDNTERSDSRLHIAIGLAKRFGARLVGIFGECDPYLANMASRRPMAIFHESAEYVESEFRNGCKEAGVIAEWQTALARRDDGLVDAMVTACRLTDLVILGQFQPGATDSGVPPEFAERIVLRSGTPQIVIPFAGSYTTIGRRVMVAWKNGRLAARALRDALPLLIEAEEVLVTAISPVDGDTIPRDENCAGVAHYLEAHGLKVKTEALVAEKGWIMDTMLSNVVDHGVDMLVMGAHGNYAGPDLPRGGGTQHILKHMTVPVLMSH